jgi:hypothetical protein
LERSHQGTLGTTGDVKQRAALICILLLGAVWAFAAGPAAAQVPEPPPPPDIPKPDKPEKPDKPGKPGDPDEPEEPGEPEPPAPPDDPDEPPTDPEPPSTPTEPEPPAEPLPPTEPPGGDEPSDDDSGGSAGPGGGRPGDPGAELRVSALGERAGWPVSAAGEPQGGLVHRDAPSATAGEGTPWVDRVVSSVLGSLDHAGGAAAGEYVLPAVAVDDGPSGTSGLPLAVFAIGLVLVSIGVAAGAARARGAGPWHPPGSRPDHT